MTGAAGRERSAAARRKRLDAEFAELDALSRKTRLSDQQSLRLEKIIKEIDGRTSNAAAPFGDRRFRQYRDIARG